ncbi:MAG: adenosylmethionine--8-amino-7-oxononanoate transaminase [Kiritimatiellae bacterium]|nr:adenosylmethionine--8-amino-7-oxononanoate transaminase [Kiritimatiellia bacterium]
MQTEGVIFISGIGTGVGKSIVTGILARDAREKGIDAITVKMVQTGCVGFSEDLQMHRKLMGGVRFPEDDEGLTAPQIFSFPSSADLAARLEGKKVDIEKIVSSVNECAKRRKLVLVESAGGLMVPLAKNILSIDIAAKENWPLILVTNGKLGSINETLLSLEAAKSRGIKILKIIYNWAKDVDPTIDEDTPKAIENWLKENNISASVERFGFVDIPHEPIAKDEELRLSAFDKKHIWHPYAPLGDSRRVRMARYSSGAEIELADGTRLIDAVSSWWCAAHGHNRPEITDAIRRQSGQMPHVMFGGFTHEPAINLAEKLSAITPSGLDKIFFADSGSIAVEVAVKMATQYQHASNRPKRTKMLALKGGYHGDTACAMALSDPDGMHTLFAGMLPKHFFADKPTSPFDPSSIIEEAEKHKDEIAGIICEPILQAANAMNIYDAEYLRTLRRIADENDFVLIFDEIATGFFRTGPLWACEYAGVKPDIMTVGKALTGGHITLAATIASSRIAETISSGSPSALMHGPTYMANPLACAAACASLDIFAKENYRLKVDNISKLLKSRLEEARKFPNVKDVRSIGAVGIIEVERLPAAKDIDRAIDSHKVWLRPFSNFIYTMPPLISDTKTIERITEAMLDLASCAPDENFEDTGFHE